MTRPSTGPDDPVDPAALGDDQPADDPEVGGTAASGFLSDTSRRAALIAALPFVATYFVRSDALELRPAPVLATETARRAGRTRPTDDQVVVALRLRAALVASRELSEVLRAALRHANFRYELVRDEHVGHLHGRLDVPRYIQARGRRTVPRRYPVIDVQRSSATPENVLASFALCWLMTELDACMARLDLSADAPEARAARAARADLGRFRTHPTLRGAADDAALVARRETVGPLLDIVDARLRAGHVTRSGGYQRLADWVRRIVAGEPVAAPGELAADFYGADFDDKLFELWCLSQLADALTAMLGPPSHSTPHLLVRDAHASVFAWEAGADVVELFFQPSLEVLTETPNAWTYGQTGQRLRGFPDIGARCRHVDGSAEVVLIDAKLRHKRGARGQEIYKLLGYTANAGRFVRYGALIFHAPTGYHGSSGDQRSHLRRDSTIPGRIELVAVDPADQPGSSDAFAVLARLVLTATGVPDHDVETVVQTGVGDPDAPAAERTASRAQAIATVQLQTMARQLPPEVLEATAANLRTLLVEAWPLLGDSVRRMTTSAVHFGVTAPDGADLSGPVLGLCASLERLLRERVASPALAHVRNRRGCDPDHWTLGTMLVRLQEALSGPGGQATQELARYLDEHQVHHDALRPLLEELDSLRGRHRNKAAHEGLIERAQWAEVFRLVIRADGALLPRLVATLPG